MDTGDKVSIWAAIFALAVALLNFIVNLSLNTRTAAGDAGIASTVLNLLTYLLSVSIFYVIAKRLMAYYYKGKSERNH